MIRSLVACACLAACNYSGLAPYIDAPSAPTDPGPAPCVAEDDAALCAAADAGACGTIQVRDSCGHARDPWCGPCPCVPEPDDALCGGLCGPQTAVDKCGAPRLLACPECPPCYPETEVQLCAVAGVECGPLSTHDGCGNARSVADCGSCAVDRVTCVAGACMRCGMFEGDPCCPPGTPFTSGHACGSIMCDAETSTCAICGRLNTMCCPGPGPACTALGTACVPDGMCEQSGFAGAPCNRDGSCYYGLTCRSPLPGGLGHCNP